MVENALEAFSLLSAPDVCCAIWFLFVLEFFTWRCDSGWRLVLLITDGGNGTIKKEFKDVIVEGWRSSCIWTRAKWLVEFLELCCV